MNKEQLESYLENVATLELAIKTQEQTLQQIDQKSKGLKRPASIIKPAEKNPRTKPWKPAIFAAISGLYNSFDDIKLVFLLIIGWGFWVGVIGWIANGAFDVPWETYWNFYLKVWLICEVIYLLKCILSNRKLVQHTENTNQKNFRVYNEAIAVDQLRLQNEEKIYNELARSYLQIQDHVVHLRSSLDKLYAQNIIYPDFRGMVPVTYLHRYITSGVAEQLEGPTGAYAQYLNDERTNRICRKLDDLSLQLSQVIQLQKQQICILGSMNQTLNHIENALHRTNQSIEQMNKRIDFLTEKQVTANEYLADISHELSQISETIDTAAINTQILALNDYRKSVLDGVNTYYLRYPA